MIIKISKKPNDDKKYFSMHNDIKIPETDE